MDITSSTATGAVRIGVQVVSANKSPQLEIYHQMRNVFGPEKELDLSDGDNVMHKYRSQDIFIEFRLVNIGGSRAENIKLTLEGDLRRNSDMDVFGSLFDTVIPQMPPGHSMFLFTFRDHDLLDRTSGNPPTSRKNESLKIIMEYDSGQGILNQIMSLPSKIRKKRRFRNEFLFFPKMLPHQYPPPEYSV